MNHPLEQREDFDVSEQFAKEAKPHTDALYALSIKLGIDVVFCASVSRKKDEVDGKIVGAEEGMVTMVNVECPRATDEMIVMAKLAVGEGLEAAGQAIGQAMFRKALFGITSECANPPPTGENTTAGSAEANH